MNHSPRADPFDPSASSRLKRAGILLDDGNPDTITIKALAGSFGGLLYDDLCDTTQSFDHVLSVYNDFQMALNCGAPKRKLYIAICLQYDALHKPLPNVMWWMAGHDGVVAVFVDAYIAKFAICCAELEQEVSKNVP